MINPRVEALAMEFPERTDRPELLAEIALWKGLPLHVPGVVQERVQVDALQELQVRIRQHEKALQREKSRLPGATGWLWQSTQERIWELEARLGDLYREMEA